MINLFGCSGVKFEKYSSKDPMINVSMDYVAGWKHDETRGSYSSYAQVIFFPEGGRKSSRALIDLTVKDNSKAGITPLTLDAAENGLLAKRMQFKDSRILSKSKIKIMDSDATVIELAYLTLEDMRNAKSKLILVKENKLTLSLDGLQYILDRCIVYPQRKFCILSVTV